MHTPRVLLLLVLLAALPGPAAGQSASLDLSDVQAAYTSLEGLQAAFTQVITSDFAGDSTRIDGSVLLSGNRYRVETSEQTVVSNDSVTWIYTPADSQVVVNDAGDRASTLTPETFLSTSARRYDVRSTTATRRLGVPHLRMEVVATNSTARFAEASLWVRRSDRVVTRMRARDRNGSVLDLRLRDLTVNPDALRGPSPFTFAAPSGVEVVDLRRGE